MRRGSVMLKLKHYRQSYALTKTARFAYLTLSVLINSCWQFNFGCPNSGQQHSDRAFQLSKFSGRPTSTICISSGRRYFRAAASTSFSVTARILST